LTQMALGSIILKNKSLSHWTRERIGKKIIGESEREKEGHLYFHFRYKKKFFSRRWEKGLSWYCPISQRIFLLMGNAELALIEIECHEKSKETSN
ncbi:hypothetical protein J7K43_06055, partial [Candidatus Calescamantes bacterium]|nr:hypothetical protein [Candidatus Calescamantes bacterium]